MVCDRCDYNYDPVRFPWVRYVNAVVAALQAHGELYETPAQWVTKLEAFPQDELKSFLAAALAR
eukprot:COSAG05_NODE_2946_length_2477_cov_1.764508_1_plen_64_part_00